MRTTLFRSALSVVLILVTVTSMALCVGCAKSLVGKAEQAYAVTADTCNAWFLFEKNNAAFCERVLPGSHAKTDQMRRDVPKILDSLRLAIDTYRDLQKKAKEQGATVTPAQLELAAGEISKGLSDLAPALTLCEHYAEAAADAKHAGK